MSCDRIIMVRSVERLGLCDSGNTNNGVRDGYMGDKSDAAEMRMSSIDGCSESPSLACKETGAREDNECRATSTESPAWVNC